MNVVKVSGAKEQASYAPSSIATNVKKDEKFNISALVPAQKKNEAQNSESTETQQVQYDTTSTKVALAASTIYIPDINLEYPPIQTESSSDLNYDTLPEILTTDVQEITENNLDFPSMISNVTHLKSDIKPNEEKKSTDYETSSVIVLGTHNIHTHTQEFSSHFENNRRVTSDNKPLGLENDSHHAKETSANYLDIPQELIPNAPQGENNLHPQGSHKNTTVEPTSINLTNTHMEDTDPRQQLKTLDLENTEATVSVETKKTAATEETNLSKELKEVIDQNSKELSNSKLQVKVIPKDGKNTRLNDEADTTTNNASPQSTRQNEIHEEVPPLKTEGKTNDTQPLSSENTKKEDVRGSEEEIQVQKSAPKKNQELNDGTKETTFNTQVSDGKSSVTTSDSGGKVDEIARAVTSQTVEGIGKHFQTNASAKSLQIQLEPVHLGKVNIQISTLDDGSLHAKFVAENKETLQILARDSSQIEQALKDNLLDNRNVQIDFATAQDGYYDGQQSQEKFDAHQANQMARAKEEYASHPEGVREYVRHTSLGYNIKA